jgi:8-oxo-dGTP pyrophosphatase MutT (NUDIX family)
MNTDLQADSYGGVLVDASGKVLLREPTQHFGQYVWTFPKGRCDVGETPRAAAQREVLEETGYASQILAPIPKVFGGTTSTTVFFLMRPVGEPAAFGWETASIRWADFDEACQLIGLTRTATGRQRDLDVLNAAIEILSAYTPARSEK